MIKAENLTVSFGRKKILDGIDLDVEKGSYLSVIGPNGAGKSTLLRSLCGILTPVSGSIEIDGLNISRQQRRELACKITYIGQPPVFRGFSVYDMISFSRYPYLSPLSGLCADDKRIIEESMELTHTKEFAKRELSGLSSGEMQRVLIASALAQETDIILFDEPVTHLDPYYDREISELINNIHKLKNITVLNATHNMNNAFRYSDRILALSKGKTVFLKPPGDISSDDISSLFNTDFFSVENPSDKKRIMVRL